MNKLSYLADQKPNLAVSAASLVATAAYLAINYFGNLDATWLVAVSLAAGVIIGKWRALALPILYLLLNVIIGVVHETKTSSEGDIAGLEAVFGVLFVLGLPEIGIVTGVFIRQQVINKFRNT